MGQPGWRAVAARAASLLLRYPDSDVLEALPVLRSALDALPETVARPLWLVAEHRAVKVPTALASEYVELFDFRRRCCLHLTYYTCGDTRRRRRSVGRLRRGVPDSRRGARRRRAARLPARRVGSGSAHATAVGGCCARTAWDSTCSMTRSLRRTRSTAMPLRRYDRCSPSHGRRISLLRARLAHTGPPVEQVGLEPFGMVDMSGGYRR
jgi:nitrate reductase delta subunit